MEIYSVHLLGKIDPGIVFLTSNFLRVWAILRILSLLGAPIKSTWRWSVIRTWTVSVSVRRRRPPHRARPGKLYGAHRTSHRTRTTRDDRHDRRDRRRMQQRSLVMQWID